MRWLEFQVAVGISYSDVPLLLLIHSVYVPPWVLGIILSDAKIGSRFLFYTACKAAEEDIVSRQLRNKRRRQSFSLSHIYLLKHKYTRRGSQRLIRFKGLSTQGHHLRTLPIHCEKKQTNFSNFQPKKFSYAQGLG